MDAYIFRRNGLGDIVMAEPIIRGLKKAGYERIWFDTVGWEGIFLRHPDMSPVVPIGQQQNGYELKRFNLTDVYEKDLTWLMIDSYADCCDLVLKLEDKIPQLHLADGERTWWVDNLIGPWAALDLGDGGALRHYWSLEQWKPVVDRLKSEGYNIVLIGLDQREPCPDFIDMDLRRKTDLRTLMAVLSCCKCFIGIAAGPMTIAYAFGLFGAVVFNPGHRVEAILPTLDKIKAVHQAPDEKDLQCNGLIEQLDLFL